MTKRKDPETVTITVAAFYDRIAWLQWHACYQEANALRELAPWFTPALRIDEARVEKRVLKYIADAQHQADPANWI
jgi:hypothetical protein